MVWIKYEKALMKTKTAPMETTLCVNLAEQKTRKNALKEKK